MTPLARLLFPLLPMVLVLALPSVASTEPGVEAPVRDQQAVRVKHAQLDLRAELSASTTVDGSLLLARLDLPPGFQNAVIKGDLEGVEIPFFTPDEKQPLRREAIVGVPFNRKPGPATLVVKVGEGTEEAVLTLPFTVTDGQYRSETLKVDPRHVNPSKRALVRIKRESAEVGAIYRTLTPRRYWRGRFQLPVDSPVTSPFGTKRVFNGEMRSFHQGLDLKARVGTQIVAPEAGRVAMAKNLYFTGYTVLLDHGFGFYTLYAHLSHLKVKKGQIVSQGQLLGLSGATGRASGPHLHWGAILNRSKINPLDLTQVLR